MLACLKNANTPDCEFVQERLLVSRSFGPGIPLGRSIGHQLESLILAQNERWRHA